MRIRLSLIIFMMFLVACAPSPAAPTATVVVEEATATPLPPTATGEFDDWISRQNPVSSLFWSGDGKYLVARANTGLYVLDAENAKVVHTLYGDGFLEPYTLDTQNQRVFAGNKMWDIATGELLYQSDEEPAWSAAFSHDGKMLALAQQNRLRLMNIDTGQVIREVEAINAFFGMAFTKDDKKLFAISDNGNVRLVNLETWVVTELFRLPPKGHHPVFSPDSRLMVINLSDGGAGHKELWDVENAKLLVASEQCDSDVALYTFSPDGKQFVIGPCGGDTQLWDVQTKKVLHKFTIPEVPGWNPEWRGGAFSADGKYLALGNDLGQIMVFDLASYNLLQTIEIPFPMP